MKGVIISLSCMVIALTLLGIIYDLGQIDGLLACRAAMR